jgi:peptidoglycan L-alanyl-D-glutamate endopeptidase CwlK
MSGLNSRDINQLTLDMQGLTRQWLAACRHVGLDILITSTYRDAEYQKYLYAQGRTRAGKIITHAKAGESAHNHRLAVDFCIMKGKQCDWADVGAFMQAGMIAEDLGLTWGGRFKMRDYAHIELTTKK